MVNAELIFEAYLNAAIPYIDMKWLADPINHLFPLTIKNQSNQTLYFKLFNAISNWDFGTTLPGTDELELGGIGAGSSSTPGINMVRELPVGDVYDGGNFTLKAYTDPAYVDEIASDDLYVTIYVMETENWTDVEIFDFPYENGGAEVCKSQGWTLSGFGCNQTKSVEAGGCALNWDVPKQSGVAWVNVSAYVERALAIPNRNMCSLAFFLTWWFGGSDRARGFYMNITLDGVLIYSRLNFPAGTQSIWHKISLNLSPYKGTTKTLRLSFGGQIKQGYTGIWKG
ncbi:unnamed protein product, partial [marine sediment metagenome]